MKKKKKKTEPLTFGFRISPEELIMIKKHAKEIHHAPTGTWIRQLILSHIKTCSQ